MNLLENTANFVSSQLSSGSTDPGVLQDVGASLLHGISNVMSAASTSAQTEEEEDEEFEDNEDSEKKAEKEEKKASKGKVLLRVLMLHSCICELHLLRTFLVEPDSRPFLNLTNQF